MSFHYVFHIVGLCLGSLLHAHFNLCHHGNNNNLKIIYAFTLFFWDCYPFFFWLLRFFLNKFIYASLLCYICDKILKLFNCYKMGCQLWFNYNYLRNILHASHLPHCVKLEIGLPWIFCSFVEHHFAVIFCSASNLYFCLMFCI